MLNVSDGLRRYNYKGNPRRKRISQADTLFRMDAKQADITNRDLFSGIRKMDFSNNDIFRELGISRTRYTGR